MDNLFNFVQALTIAHDSKWGLSVHNGCHSDCVRKQRVVDVINFGKEQGLKVRQQIREAKIKNGDIISLDYKEALQ